MHVHEHFGPRRHVRIGRESRNVVGGDTRETSVPLNLLFADDVVERIRTDVKRFVVRDREGGRTPGFWRIRRASYRQRRRRVMRRQREWIVPANSIAWTGSIAKVKLLSTKSACLGVLVYYGHVFVNTFASFWNQVFEFGEPCPSVMMKMLFVVPAVSLSNVA